LVKWKESDEQTWEPEYHFDTTEIIDEYWNEINKRKPDQVFFCLADISKAFRLLSGHSTQSLFIMMPNQ
jgi:hypothetical protein